MLVSIYTDVDGRIIVLPKERFVKLKMEVVDWCHNWRDSLDTDGLHALSVLDRVAASGGTIDSETCKHLFNVITINDEKGCCITKHFWYRFTEDGFNYKPFALFAPPEYCVSDYGSFTRSPSEDDWQKMQDVRLYLFNPKPGPHTHKEEFDDFLKTAAWYLEYINGSDNDFRYDFSPPKCGCQQSFITDFIELVADAAINGRTLHFVYS